MYPSKPRHIEKNGKSGFTLVEILAATGIMLVIILLVLTLTTNVLSSWTRSSGQLQTNFEARVALDLLTSDLESMVLRSRPINWLQLEYKDVQDADDTPILYFFAPALERPRFKNDPSPDTEILGDVCAIAYQLDYKNPFTNDTTAGKQPIPIYGLYRSVVDAENTFNHALSIRDYKSDDDDGATLLDYWTGEAVDSTGGDVSTDVIGEDGDTDDIDKWVLKSSNFLSQNVADFRVVFHYRDRDGDIQSIDPPQKIIYADQLYVDGVAEPGARLEYVDVTLTILSNEGATALNSDPNVDYDTAVERYGEVFTRRINLMSSGF